VIQRLCSGVINWDQFLVSLVEQRDSGRQPPLTEQNLFKHGLRLGLSWKQDQKHRYQRNNISKKTLEREEKHAVVAYLRTNEHKMILPKEYLKLPRASHFLGSAEIWGKTDGFKDLIVLKCVFYQMLSRDCLLDVLFKALKKSWCTWWEIWEIS